MSVSTFGSFTTARLGLYASQKALEVTGHNIANINTTGYTRQVLRQDSLYIGGSDRYRSAFDVRVGAGVLPTGVSQLRDPYLDIRYRNELASVGATDAKLNGLQELAGILDEVGKGPEGDGIIELQFKDIYDQLQNLVTDGAGRADADRLVRSSAESLVRLFNSYASKLDGIEKDRINDFKQDLKSINNILDNIRNLNDSIRSSQIHGGDALELRDQRNLLIDDLSKMVKIDVTYEQEYIGADTYVEKLVIKMAGNGQGNSTEHSTLIDGIFGTNFSITQVPDPNNPPAEMDSPNFDITLSELKNSKGTVLTGSAAVELRDNDLFGALQASREILTEAGEFSTQNDLTRDPQAAIKRGIPFYRNMLDALARKFAETMNTANNLNPSDYMVDVNDATQGVKPEYEDYFLGTDPADTTTYLVPKPGYEKYFGGNLFSNHGDSDNAANITAKNISISFSWSTGAINMLQSKEPDFQSSDNSNLLHMLTLMTRDIEYKPSDLHDPANPPVDVNDRFSNTTFFKGKFQDMYTNICAVLSNDISTTTSMLENYVSAADNLYVEREAVSGVDLNDEAMSMMQFQKSYSAAARLMTTLDEMLDKLINGTGRAGL